MFSKILVWIILAVSTIFGGSYLADAQAISSNFPGREEIMASHPDQEQLHPRVPSVNSSEDVTATVTVMPEPQMTPSAIPLGRDEKCTSVESRDHPVAERIAQEFGVSVDEIIQLFCRGYGFGEIELAYAIAAKSGVPVAEVVAKRDAGEGWGNIMKDYGFHGNPKNGHPNPGRGRGKGNQ